MQKSLVIVESPAKVKSISKYLGKQFIVKSSIGHIRDLPKASRDRENQKSKRDAAFSNKIWPDKNAQRLAKRMAVDPYHGWEAQYEIDPNKMHVVKELKTLAQSADFIYLATDLDREGEAIAWHLQEILGGDNARYRRVTFNAITKTAIQEAFYSPRSINMDRVHAQQTRRFLDRVVGFMLSPLLWKKICKNLSAGRVQSPAVRLVVEREHAIKNFLPTSSFGIIAYLGKSSSGPFLGCELKKLENKPFKCESLSQAQTLVEQLRSCSFKIIEIEKRSFFSKPHAPFTTSTLQQAASARLNFSVKKTMTLAQRLYESGCITYMRTDSTYLSAESLQNARKWINNQYGPSYLPPEAMHYASKSNAQEAHEAIRPTDIYRSPQDIEEKFDSATAKLYELIWKRFLASQMVPAEYETNKIFIETVVNGQRAEFQIKGQRLIFDGWSQIYPEKTEDFITIPTDWRPNDPLISQKIHPKKFVTRPPARYTEASLVKELDKRGIGRPSTYESIIETIQKRGYVQLKQRRFYALKLGEITAYFLQQRFEPWMSYDFTAQMENSLDSIAKGREQWQDVLNQFFFPFSETVNLASHSSEKGGLPEIRSVEISALTCPDCHRPFLLHVNAFGLFLACSGYRLSENPCKVLSLKRIEQSLEDNESTQDKELLEKEITDLTEEAETSPKISRCPQCQSIFEHYQIDNKAQKFSLCGNYPHCQCYEISDLDAGENQEKQSDAVTIACPECHETAMSPKTGRFGPYMLCSQCKATRKILKNGSIAPKSSHIVALPELACLRATSDHYLLRSGSSGLFLAASQFPKVREARAITIEELQRFSDRLPPEWRLYAEAPAQDPEGNPTVLRFNRKSQSQYVGSKKNGRWTKFVFEYSSS